jgi:hypothetical protein
MHDAAAANLKVSSTSSFFVDGLALTGEHALDKFDERSSRLRPSEGFAQLSRSCGLIARRRYGG